MSNKNWELLFVFPNLLLDKAYSINLDSEEFLSITSFKDPRISQMCKHNKTIAEFLNNFVDHRMNKIEPSIMILNKSVAKPMIDFDCIISFRNILALSILLPEWSSLGIYSNHTYMWSDYFDFYPFTISSDDRLIMNAPGMNLFSPKGFAKHSGISSPHLIRPNKITYLTIDTNIFNSLCTCWKNYYLEGSSDVKLNSLFRSLKIAYSAISSPIKNQGSIFDYGLSIMQWVSAFEILIHPINNKSGPKYVSKLLGKYIWHDELLNNSSYQYKDIELNLIQYLYYYLNDRRNDFTHGNPIDTNLLFPISKKDISIVSLAPSIYRTALFEYMELYLNCKHSPKILSDRMIFIGQNAYYENCFLSLLKTTT